MEAKVWPKTMGGGKVLIGTKNIFGGSGYVLCMHAKCHIFEVDIVGQSVRRREVVQVTSGNGTGEVHTADTNVTLHDLQPSSTYTVSVVAQNKAGRANTPHAPISVHTCKYVNIWGTEGHGESTPILGHGREVPL